MKLSSYSCCLNKKDFNVLQTYDMHRKKQRFGDMNYSKCQVKTINLKRTSVTSSSHTSINNERGLLFGK
jgi:hypothetical protein